MIQKAQGVEKDGSLKINTIYLQHVVHMPKMAKATIPTIPSLTNSKMHQNIAPVDDEFAAEQNEMSQSDIYNEKEDQSNAAVPDVVYQGNDISSNLLLRNDSQDLDTITKDIHNLYPIKNRGGLYNVGFSSKSDQGLLYYSFKDSSLLLNPTGTNSVTADVYSNTITYSNIYPDTDLNYTLERDQLKEAFTVHRYTGKNVFNFQLRIRNKITHNCS